MKTKTVTVSFQLRVPKDMRVGEVEAFVKNAIDGESGYHHPSTNEHKSKLYRDRVEVFAP